MNDNKVKNLVITAFFTAITFLGIQSFRIPLPAAVGTPFLHFGHIFVVMGLLLQGGKRGAVSGTLGLTIFDMLNGYMQDAPKTFVETAVKCLIVGALFMMLKKKADGDKKKEYGAAVKESGEDVVSQPEIDIVQLEKGKPFIFTAEVAVKPEVTLGKYMGVTVTKIDTTVSAGEKDLCAHGIEGDITDFFLWKLADTYEVW